MQAPNTNWIRVVENLDYEGFYCPSEEAFSFFMSVYKYACQVYFCNMYMDAFKSICLK